MPEWVKVVKERIKATSMGEAWDLPLYSTGDGYTFVKR
jgi:hypothetical protein